MASPKAYISKPSKKPKFTIIPPKQLFIDFTNEDTRTPSPKLHESSPSAPNAPYKNPSTKDTLTFSIDYTVFNKKKDSNLIIVQIYVDDIIFGSTCQEICADFAKSMHDEFEMKDPKTSYLEAVKRIFRYIKGTTHLGLWYPKGSGIETIVYADSDHAGD
ncbi:hypothetical protein Tco_0317757 [Tanacetum coccineum]